MVLSLRLLKEWGYDKLRAHVDRVAQFYHAKRDVFERLMHKYLDGLAEWNTPEAGMFFWFVMSYPSSSAIEVHRDWMRIGSS